MMAIEMRKRPVIIGADVMKFLQRAEQNKKKLRRTKSSRYEEME